MYLLTYLCLFVLAKMVIINAAILASGLNSQANGLPWSALMRKIGFDALVMFHFADLQLQK